MGDRRRRGRRGGGEERKKNGKKNTFPAIREDQAEPFLRTVAVDGVRGVYQVQEHVVEQGLKRGDRSPLRHEQRRECVGGGNAER